MPDNDRMTNSAALDPMPRQYAIRPILPGHMLRLPILLLRKLGVLEKRQIDIDIVGNKLVISRPKSPQEKRIERLKSRINARRLLAG
jgi:hypothetical protein